MKITAKTLKKIVYRMFLSYSKKELLAFLKDKLATDRRWAGRALERIYQGQTREEQIDKITKELNNVGFSGKDSEFLTSLYEWYVSHNKTLSTKQWVYLQKIIPRYAGQLLRSNYFKMETLVAQYAKYLEEKTQS